MGLLLSMLDERCPLDTKSVSSEVKDAFIIGLDHFNRQKLGSIKNPKRYRFHDPGLT